MNSPLRDSSPDDTPVVHSAHNWADVAGLWTFSGPTARYLGPDQENTSTPLGLAVCEHRFRDGRAIAKISFSKTVESAGGILLGYQSVDLGYFTVSLGGHDRAYSVSEYIPGRGWISLVGAGNARNLRASRPYELSVSVSGQTLLMSVDDVQVFTYVFSRPIEGTGLGFYAWGESEVTFENLSIDGRQPQVFVIMPFKEPYDTVYREVIEPVATAEGFNVVRIDEIDGPGVILDDIQQQIRQSHAVIAEVSNHNPNVFYELGYAHALGKPSVLLVRRQDTEPMPFDIRGFRAIFYDDSIGGKHQIERKLREHLKALMRGSFIARDVG